MTTTLEVVKQALVGEVRSQAFYCLAAEVTDRDDTRVLFMELGDLEGDHARELARRIAGPPLNLDFDADAYLAETEDSVHARVAPADERVVRSGDVRAVLKLARRLEAESRDTYRRLAEEIRDPELKAFCEELVSLEAGHMDEIRKLERALDMAEEARPAL